MASRSRLSAALVGRVLEMVTQDLLLRGKALSSGNPILAEFRRPRPVRLGFPQIRFPPPRCHPRARPNSVSSTNAQLPNEKPRSVSAAEVWRDRDSNVIPPPEL